MKEIKFRAWDRNNKWMIYPDKTTEKYCCTFGINEVLKLHSGQTGEYYEDSYGYSIFMNYEKLDYELMQYINYKDINEEELYEKDIIHYHRHEGWYVGSVPVYKLGVIAWDETALGYRIFPIDTHSYKINYGVNGEKIRTSHRIIKVGNTFESDIKELVEKFKRDVYNIEAEIRKNKRTVKDLAEKQRQLKDIRKGLYELLRLVK